MSHLRITVDGVIVMDADPGEWVSTPPNLDQLNLAAGNTPQPWYQTIMFTIAQAGILAHAGQRSSNTNITVITRPDGWNLDVTG